MATAPMTRWERAGSFFRAEGQRPWMATHSQMPHHEVVEGSLIRVYFSSRDAQNRTHISWLLLDLERPDRIAGLADHPLLAPGDIGLFDDMGVMSSWMTLEGGLRHFYTIGWNVKNRVPMHTSIGLARAPAAGEPVISQRLAGPVFERNPANPYYVSCPCVLKVDGEWRMWFMNGLPWGMNGETPFSRYDVGYARSPDGVTWIPDPAAGMGLLHTDEIAIARPCVVRDPDLWRMWHCYRGTSFEYRIGYAESDDGLTWRRRDDHMVLPPAGDGFDSAMTCYPYVFDHGGERWMLYCGDRFGQGGLGLARLTGRGGS